jgi:hypothetical protein
VLRPIPTAQAGREALKQLEFYAPRRSVYEPNSKLDASGAVRERWFADLFPGGGWIRTTGPETADVLKNPSISASWSKIRKRDSLLKAPKFRFSPTI